VESGAERLRAHFREDFRRDPASALSQWFRAQEELRDRGDAATSAALADDLWESLPDLPFDSEESRARFFHNAAVFFGSPGAGSNLDRARFGFELALRHFSAHGEDGWRARALHNLATSIANLGGDAADLRQAVGLFDEALAWRTGEREIARAVTLHNLGRALVRLAALDPDGRREHLRRSDSVLCEAIEIRGRLGLSEGLEASEAALRETRARLADPV